ncbi:MAG: hypothetical protein R3C99_19045 [Pirellulaceae bacterium]
MNRTDVGVIQLSGRSGFAQEAAAPSVVGAVRSVRNLQSHVARQLRIVGQPYGSHSAAAQRPDQTIAAKELSGLGSERLGRAVESRVQFVGQRAKFCHPFGGNGDDRRQGIPAAATDHLDQPVAVCFDFGQPTVARFALGQMLVDFDGQVFGQRTAVIGR